MERALVKIGAKCKAKHNGAKAPLREGEMNFSKIRMKDAEIAKSAENTI